MTGHALNKITKDLINRSKLIQGYRIEYVSLSLRLCPLVPPQGRGSHTQTCCSYTPGFDTHGLPLELKALAALNKPASELTPQQIRRAARKEAEKGIATQTGEFKSFAVMGEWDEPYRTMDWSYEKRQLEVVRDMVKKGGAIVSLYGPRPCLRL